MKSVVRCILSLALVAAAAETASAAPDIQITEWMYSGGGGEFIEFTNLGDSAASFSGWVYDDDSRFATVAAGGFSLTAFGSVAPGESVILTEGAAATFIAAWSLAPTIKVIGGYTNNLGRADEINVFDSTGALVDRLGYGDVVFPGTVRTQSRSGNPADAAALVPFTVTPGWVLASAGDAFASMSSSNGDVGNPGRFAAVTPVPEPETYALLLAGLAVVAGVARRRSPTA